MGMCDFRERHITAYNRGICERAKSGPVYCLKIVGNARPSTIVFRMSIWSGDHLVHVGDVMDIGSSGKKISCDYACGVEPAQIQLGYAANTFIKYRMRGIIVTRVEIICSGFAAGDFDLALSGDNDKWQIYETPLQLGYKSYDVCFHKPDVMADLPCDDPAAIDAIKIIGKGRVFSGDPIRVYATSMLSANDFIKFEASSINTAKNSDPKEFWFPSRYNYAVTKSSEEEWILATLETPVRIRTISVDGLRSSDEFTTVQLMKNGRIVDSKKCQARSDLHYNVKAW